MQDLAVPQVAVVRWRIVTPGTGAARGRAACSGLADLQRAQALRPMTVPPERDRSYSRMPPSTPRTQLWL